MRPKIVAISFAAVVAAACARGQSDYVGEPGSGGPGVVPAAQGDGGGTQGTSSGGASGSNGGTSSGGTSGSSGGSGGNDAGGSSGGDAGSDASNAKDATPPPPPDDAGGLDPLLSLPDPSGVPCVPFEAPGPCPSLSMCRISSPNGGRCETCTTCGNLGASCSATNECDILFECYAGACTNICRLGSYECGAITDCINVGHTTMGVCRP